MPKNDIYVCIMNLFILYISYIECMNNCQISMNCKAGKRRGELDCVGGCIVEMFFFSSSSSFVSLYYVSPAIICKSIVLICLCRSV